MSVRSWVSCLLVCGALAVFVGSAAAAPISIDNYSFESPALSPGGWTTAATDWTLSGDAGVTFLSGQPQYPGPIPEGNNVAYINSDGGYIQQDLGATLTAGQIYRLSVWLGVRTDDPVFDYQVELRANGTPLAASSFIHPVLVGYSGTFSQDVEIYSADANAAYIGQPLSIRLTRPSGPGQANFDLVQLETIPEPGTLGLLLAGISLVAVRLRRRA